MNSILTYIHTLDEAGYLMDYSARFAKDMSLQLDLLYTVQLQNYPMGIPAAVRPTYQYTNDQIETLLEEAEAKFVEKTGDIKKNLENCPEINYFTRQGVSHHIIENFTQNDKYAFVLVSASPDNKFLINDRNMDIIKHVGCPVWIIPENYKYKKVGSIIYATDYQEADIKTMQKLTRLTTDSSTRITALHVNKNQDFDEKVKTSGFREEVVEKVGYKNIEVIATQPDDDKTLEEVINDFAVKKDAGLIVVLKKNKGFFEALFGKSSTKKIISNTRFPVLIFHDAQ